MEQKPPIFIISGKSPLRDSGGYPAYSRTLAITLTSLGYSVHTLAIGEADTVKKTEYGEVRLLTTKLIRLFPLLRHLALAGLPYYSIIFAREIQRIIKEKKIKAFILWGMGPWAFPAVLLKLFVPRKIKRTIIVSYFTSTRHEMKGALDAIRIKDYGVFPKIRYFLVYTVVAQVFQFFEQLTLNYSDLVVIHYQSSKKIIQKYFRVPDKKIHLFPWYTEIFKRKGATSSLKQSYSHPLIISICRQDPRKGLNFLIRAVKILSKEIPDINCLIIGTGSFLKLNQKLIKKLGVEKNITMPGFISDIKPVLKEADIAVIIPTAQGSSALTVLEAMSFGKAIVGSNCDGIPEDIVHNSTGLIIKRADEEALAKALRKLIKNPQLRDKLGKNAYLAYKNRFGFDKMKLEIKKMLYKYAK